MTPEQREERRHAAQQRRAIGYAIHFALDCVMDCYQPNDGEPTDDNLALVLAGCARPPRPAEYPMIRDYVELFRKGQLPI